MRGWAVVGGAPLGERLAHFYRGIGLPVLEGYGLTETSAAITVNTPDENRVGTVGRPLPNTEVRVDSGCELQVRGLQVFSGYWNDPSATDACLDEDGWFSTGDLQSQAVLHAEPGRGRIVEGKAAGGQRPIGPDPDAAGHAHDVRSLRQ